jgi:hypothetical protein
MCSGGLESPASTSPELGLLDLEVVFLQSGRPLSATPFIGRMEIMVKAFENMEIEKGRFHFRGLSLMVILHHPEFRGEIEGIQSA